MVRHRPQLSAPPPGHAPGFTLIEILIALFIFMIGVLGIFAVIPVAMDQSARAVRKTRGQIMAQYAVASLVYDLQAALPFYKGALAANVSSGATSFQAAGSPGWSGQWSSPYHALITSGAGRGAIRGISSNTADTLTVTAGWPDLGQGDKFEVVYYEGMAIGGGAANELKISTNPWTADQWKDLYVSIIAGCGMGQARRITGNGTDTLTVSRPWTVAPTTASRFRVAAVALDAINQETSPRDGTVMSDPTDNTITTDQNGLSFDTTNGDFFILITSGRAAGTVCKLTGVTGGNVIVTTAGAKLQTRGLRAGDTYYIVGNRTGVYSYPGNHFGTPNTPQTAPDPSFPDRPEYRYVIVFSDPGAVRTGSLSPVRVDALVFRNYDNAKLPSKNKKAAAFVTAYVTP